MNKIRILKENNEVCRYLFWCPGCEEYHGPTNKWQFNGDVENPTLNPSVLVHSVKTPDPIPRDKDGKLILDDRGRVMGAKDTVCHSFIKDGKIEFLSDCTHSLAGKTVELGDADNI